MSVRDRDDLVVARLQQLAPHLDGEPDPAWQATTRARLVAMAAVRSPAPEAVSPWRRFLSGAADAAPSRWRSRLTAGLAGAAMAVTALATLVAVSTDASPGDPLYGLKRGTEQTQLALAGDGRGQTLLDFARTRLHELEELAEGGASALPTAGTATGGRTVLAADADPDLVLETLATMDAQTTEGAAFLTDRAVATRDGSSLDLLAAWSEEQAAGLTALREALPESTVDEVDGSLARLTEIETRTVALSDVLVCAAGVPVEATDQFGPVPGLCLPDENGTPPVAGGETDPGTTPAPGGTPEGTAAVPTPGTPSGGVSTGGPQQSGGGEGEGEGPTVPTGEVPGGGGPSVPGVPSVTLPTPTISIGVPAPGSSTGAGSSTSSGSTSTAPVLQVCLPPLVVVNCD
jgi:hypothetical protein